MHARPAVARRACHRCCRPGSGSPSPRNARATDASAGQRLEREPGEPIRAAHHLPRRRRRQPVRIVLHPPAAGVVEPAERHIDAALVRLRPALDHGPIGLADLAVAEQQVEVGQRLPVAAEHQAAGGFLVEPMRQRRQPRQAKAQRIEIVLDARAALRPSALVHGKPGGLVDDQHQPVAVEQAAPHLFRCHGGTGITASGMNDSTNESGDKKGWFGRLAGGLSAPRRRSGPRSPIWSPRVRWTRPSST